MKESTKRIVITVINVAIFALNAVITYINGGSNVAGAIVATGATGALTGAVATMI